MSIRKNLSRRACLDVHSPLYLKSKKSQFCGGDIGDIYRLVDRASEAGFSLLQFTPIQDTGINPSPYMGISIFSYNPAYLSLDHLPQKTDFSKIDKKQFQHAKSSKLNHVSYHSIYKLKVQALHQIFENKSHKIQFTNYDREILAYAIFKTLKEKYRCRWVNWPTEYREVDLQKIINDHPSLHTEIKFHLFIQDILGKQWRDLATYARKKGVELMLDKPIYPVHDSAEVWANQELFYLKKNGELRYGSGCNNPHDPFGAQYWGQAVYKFKEKPHEVIAYFIKAIKFISQTADNIRLDHTLALIWKYYLANPKTKKGRHYPALKGRLFTNILQQYPDICFIAEDLGYVSRRNVDLPLSKYKLPGMRSPQWCLVPKYANIQKYPENCLALTSNHDLDSLPSWWRKLRLSRRQIFWRQLNELPAKDFQDQVWQIVELIFNSKAAITSISLRDLCFDLRRYNKPGLKNSQNWTMRMEEDLEEIDFSRLSEIIDKSNRKI